jgi:hypothetical protein
MFSGCLVNSKNARRLPHQPVMPSDHPARLDCFFQRLFAGTHRREQFNGFKLIWFNSRSDDRQASYTPISSLPRLQVSCLLEIRGLSPDKKQYLDRPEIRLSRFSIPSYSTSQNGL